MSMPWMRIFRLVALALTAPARLATAALSRALRASHEGRHLRRVAVWVHQRPADGDRHERRHGPVESVSRLSAGRTRRTSSSRRHVRRPAARRGRECQLGIRFRPNAAGTRVAHLRSRTTARLRTVDHAGGKRPNRESTARAAAVMTTSKPADERPAQVEQTNAPVSTGNSARRPRTTNPGRRSGCRREGPEELQEPPHLPIASAANGVRFTKVSVRLNKKLIWVRRGKRLTAGSTCKGLPRGRFTLRVVATTASGRRSRRSRHYVTCVKSRG